MVGATYLTQNMTVNSIFYHVHLGKLQAPLTQDGIFVPTLPKLNLPNMPSFFCDEDLAFLGFVFSQFSTIDKVD